MKAHGRRPACRAGDGGGLVERAKAGDVPATELLLDRILGPPAAPDKSERREREEESRRELRELLGGIPLG